MGSFADTTYPREGTETCVTSRPFIDWKTQLIPARGRKPGARSRRPDALDTTYPREGTETIPAVQPGHGTQLIPARGRKPPLDTTYPREGTETIGTTYPREGTETIVDQEQTIARTQLIPARGRKLEQLGKSVQIFPDTTYPREGTETCRSFLRIVLPRRHNLSPRGDGNFQQRFHCVTAPDTTYPREGTETDFSRTAQLLHCRHNLSPRGDGNSERIESFKIL